MTTSTSILAFHGDQALRDETVARMRHHREQDDFIRGTYVQLLGDDAPRLRGCFHGCLTAEKLVEERSVVMLEEDFVNWHAETERIFGIPRRLGSLLDDTFERLDAAAAGRFAVEVTEAIPVGADLSRVVDLLMVDLLIDPTHGVLRHTEPNSDAYNAINRVAGLYNDRLDGVEPTTEQWIAARRAAEEAWAAGVAAARVAAAWAAEEAAEEAAGAAWFAERVVKHVSEAR